jgi:hypothetical protein
VKIDIDSKTQDRVVIETMLELLQVVNNDIATVVAKHEKLPHDKENLRDYRYSRRDMIRILRYFTVWEEFRDRIVPHAPDYRKVLKNREYPNIEYIEGIYL